MSIDLDFAIDFAESYGDISQMGANILRLQIDGHSTQCIALMTNYSPRQVRRIAKTARDELCRIHPELREMFQK